VDDSRAQRKRARDEARSAKEFEELRRTVKELEVKREEMKVALKRFCGTLQDAPQLLRKVWKQVYREEAANARSWLSESEENRDVLDAASSYSQEDFLKEMRNLAPHTMQTLEDVADGWKAETSSDSDRATAVERAVAAVLEFASPRFVHGRTHRSDR